MNSSIDLSGRVVVVTGAGGGIGSAVTAAFAASGADVAATDLSEESLKRTVENLAGPRGPVTTIRCDVTDESDIEAAVARTVDEYGRIDALVNVAGTSQVKGPLIEMPLEEWNRVLSVNLSGPMLFAKHVGRIFVEQERPAAIVNIASLGAQLARLNTSAYLVSKAALVHLTHLQALELAQHGVRVNAVSPGAVATPMLKKALERDDMAKEDDRAAGDPRLFRLPIPMGRIAEPAEIAAAVLFLVSDAASFITGQVLGVDGGESLF